MYKLRHLNKFHNFEPFLTQDILDRRMAGLRTLVESSHSPTVHIWRDFGPWLHDSRSNDVTWLMNVFSDKQPISSSGYLSTAFTLNSWLWAPCKKVMDILWVIHFATSPKKYDSNDFNRLKNIIYPVTSNWCPEASLRVFWIYRKNIKIAGCICNNANIQ